MEERQDYDRLADRLGEEADRLGAENEQLKERIDQTRDDWNRKRSDDAVPGAQPFPEEADRDAPGDQVNPWDAGRGEHEAPETEARRDRPADDAKETDDRD